MNYYDENELKKTFTILKPNNQLFEIRIHYDNKKIVSGYFTDGEVAIKELKKIDLRKCNVYMTLNEINKECYNRQQKDRLIQTNTTTSDNNITGIDWLMVDLDPNRPKDTSSSNEKFEESKILCQKVYIFLKNLGFEEPIIGISGNGTHLLYKVSLNSNDQTKELIHKCLQALDMLFSYGEKEKNGVGVDVSTHNQSRVCKLYGTLAQKGSNSENAPHRMSRIVKYPEIIKPTSIEYLQKLAAMLPKKEEPHRYNNFNADFDIESWMDKHGLRYKKASYSDGNKYILDCCPFDSSHKGKDACIFASRGQGYGFHCFHNSCANKTWKDVRLLYEPDAYDKKYEAQSKIQYKSFNRNTPKESKKIELKDDNPIFYSAIEILNLPRPDETFIKTGITQIDRKLRGLQKGMVSVWSGLRGSAKSTVLSEIGLNAINEGNNIAFFSGELAPKNFMRWMIQQAAGKNFVETTQFEGYYSVPRKYQEKISNWMGTKFWLYNNDYGNDSKAILEIFEKAITEKKLDFLVLDNLMAFDLATINADKWEAQKDFVWALHDLAQKHNVHIAFVAHPRKAMGFLRLDDISGSADISNAVEYAFIVHRNNNDFRRLTKQMFGWSDTNTVYEGTNIIEICKDRDGGTQDYFIPLYYEEESKRIKNDKSENIIYGWCSDDLVEKRIVEETPFD